MLIFGRPKPEFEFTEPRGDDVRSRPLQLLMQPLVNNELYSCWSPRSRNAPGGMINH